MDLVTVQIALAAGQDILFACAAGGFACGVMGKHSELFALDLLRLPCAAFTLGLVLTALANLWLQASIMSGEPLGEAAPAVYAVLTKSHFGLAWSVGFTGALLTALSCLHRGRQQVLFFAGIVLMAAGKAAASHAADAGDFSWREAVHVAHLLATAFWAGSVMVAAILLRGCAHASGSSPEQCAEFCSVLSHLATSALVVVVITGGYNVMQETTHASMPLLAKLWGRLLAAKLSCVALATVLGGWNRMVVLPKLHMHAERHSPDYPVVQRRFNRALVAEAVVMLAVLTLAAVLGHTAPSTG